jgi:hypothetical protein
MEKRYTRALTAPIVRKCSKSNLMTGNIGRNDSRRVRSVGRLWTEGMRMPEMKAYFCYFVPKK